MSGATEVARVRADTQGNLVFATLNGTNKDISFRAGDDTDTDVFIQSSTGGVGIGTTGPGAKLDVAGDINTSTQYNIGGSRVLSVMGTGHAFVAGEQAGSVNTTGQANSFVGFGAGQSTTDGCCNSFFGANAGGSNTSGSFNNFFGHAAGGGNTIGSDNAFFGEQTGSQNTEGINNAFFGALAGLHSQTGSNNAFFGLRAGQTNTTGQSNTFIGQSADAASNNLFNATAIGANAQVGQSNSLVLGSINGVNSALNATKVGIGTTTPSSVLHIVSQVEQIITASSSWHGGTWFNLANTDTGGRTWNLISSASQNGEGAGKLLIRDASSDVRMTFDTNGNVGIGTTGPNAKLHVSGGDAAITTQGNGLILRATDGIKCYRVTVNNAGVLSTTNLGTCP